MSELHSDGGTEDVANAIRTAAERLEAIEQANQDWKNTFENHDWSGLDRINQAGEAIDATRDGLADLADKIGVGGQLVREAHNNNQMVGTKESVTG